MGKEQLRATQWGLRFTRAVLGWFSLWCWSTVHPKRSTVYRVYRVLAIHTEAELRLLSSYLQNLSCYFGPVSNELCTPLYSP